MSPGENRYARRDQVIAGLLWYGTWFACALIAAGIVMAAAAPLPAAFSFLPGGHDVVKAGVAVFILLPMARLALMLAIFLRERDYAYAVIAAVVLAIIVAGIVIEI